MRHTLVILTLALTAHFAHAAQLGESTLAPTQLAHFGTNDTDDGLPLHISFRVSRITPGYRDLLCNIGLSDGVCLTLNANDTITLDLHTTGGLETFTAPTVSNNTLVVVDITANGFDMAIGTSMESRLTATPLPHNSTVPLTFGGTPTDTATVRVVDLLVVEPATRRP